MQSPEIPQRIRVTYVGVCTKLDSFWVGDCPQQGIQQNFTRYYSDPGNIPETITSECGACRGTIVFRRVQN
ncbi:hypothetical protein JW766_02565 [Candidatus Dojkabacteria bacterium]|nr:hypothetical protein [Candidatus Dojkabacteria bacterium]